MESVALLLAAPAAGQADTDCSGWNSTDFWQEARASDVTRCFGGNAASVDINARNNNDGTTPLHLAATLGTAETVNALLAAGADIHARTKGGFTPLHLAAARETAKTVNALVAAGADIHARSDLEGSITPLHSAAVGGGTAETVNALLAAGADINSRSYPEGNTPLHLAAEYGMAETVNALIAAGAGIRACQL